MNKRAVIGVVSAIVILLGMSSNNQSTNFDTVSPSNTLPTTEIIPIETKPTCDGTIVTSSCVLDEVNYKTYIYHAAVPEKTHTKTVITYDKQITGYCTLCSDGTYSPSCATGRGACSHHGGVAQWNSPVYRNVPIYNTETVIDAPAQSAYYDKVLE